MSGKLRHEKECENCGYTVDVAYCSKCGQKNVETRQTFPKLVGHFAEDLTHYDTAFWRTLRDIILKPGRVIKTYLEGKRQQYVPPVKLYIFVSFVTFLLLAILTNPYDKAKHEDKTLGSVYHNPKTENEETDKNEVYLFDKVYVTPEQVEEDYKNGEIPYLIYKFTKAMVEHKNVTNDTLFEAFMHTLPKALFFYMPLFAFWIWLFHGKKRWYFFDHGIFTLYYFSFLLISITIVNLITWLCAHVFSESMTENINDWLTLIAMIYAFFYFFRAHRRMYGESRMISRLKSLALFVINMICMLFAMCIIFYFALISIH